MKKMFKHLHKKENGNAIILVALAMGGMIAMLGLVIDGGHLYMQKSHLQKTANAAALSGGQELPNGQENVNLVVDEVLKAHEERTSMQGDPEIGPDRFSLKVILKKDVPLFFSSLFGVESVPINVYAKAELNPMGAAVGAVPLGINESVDLIYGDTYSLKVDAGDSASGNFGVLALDGPGSKLYEESLTYGFDEELKVGDIINTQTGNIAGATRDGIDYRINSCPDPNNMEDRDCARVMLVLVYKPHEFTSNQMKSVEITGFAYFYVKERVSGTDDSIQGIFIKRTGPGTSGSADVPDRGAYALKLTK